MLIVMKLRFILLIFLLNFFAPMANAKLSLHLGIIYNKGIGKGFFLSNEKHTIEQVDEKEKVTVNMKGGYRVEVYALFIPSTTEYGPSGFVRIKGNIINPKGKIVKTLNEPPLDIYLGQEKRVVYQDNSGEEVELRISPHPF